MWWNDFLPMPWMFFGPVMMLIFLVICITMMVMMMRGMSHGRAGHDAVDILKERYARGEIDKTEYEERRRLLQA